MVHIAAFNGIASTYSAAELAAARTARQCTPAGVHYRSDGQVGKKAAGITLLKEAHHSPDDIRRAKRWIAQRFRLVTEISTAKPESI